MLRCGVECAVKNDSLFINPTNNKSILDENIQTDYDHRIAMAFSVMATRLGRLKINQSDSIATSFPSFSSEFEKVGGIIS